VGCIFEISFPYWAHFIFFLSAIAKCSKLRMQLLKFIILCMLEGWISFRRSLPFVVANLWFGHYRYLHCVLLLHFFESDSWWCVSRSHVFVSRMSSRIASKPSSFSSISNSLDEVKNILIGDSITLIGCVNASALPCLRYICQIPRNFHLLQILLLPVHGNLALMVSLGVLRKIILL